MTEVRSVGRRRGWERMVLSHVGDVSVVMQKKSGPHFDPSPVHSIKRGNGPKSP
jgi:hypothetical protein